MFTPDDFVVSTLGDARFDAQDVPGLRHFRNKDFWIDEAVRIPFELTCRDGEACDASRSFERAGPRRWLYFNPAEVQAGIVTCGGICPGINDVIRALFMELHHQYGVPKVYGFRYGYRGLDPAAEIEPEALTPRFVSDIHTKGGTVLGTARGFVEPAAMVDHLQRLGVRMLFVVGGDGTQRGAHAICEAAKAVKYPLAVVGIPKTIDNDIHFVYKTFGFDTAVSFAKKALDAAHIEARDNPNGIGLVKVMGRDAGFIAALATLASIDVNYTLVPEVPFALEGPHGLLACLEARIAKRGHAVIVVAEGAGQHLLSDAERQRDASGNLKHADIGVFLKERIVAHFRHRETEVNLKYIDPSYMLRALPSNANDSIFAASLARLAVHAAMAGKTDVMIGRRFNSYIHVPIPMAVHKRKCIDPSGTLWMQVLQATGQPPLQQSSEHTTGTPTGPK